jgi:hypothetical protein
MVGPGDRDLTGLDRLAEPIKSFSHTFARFRPRSPSPCVSDVLCSASAQVFALVLLQP